MSLFWDKVEKTETCWLWIGASTSSGYGIVSVGGINRLAHRVSYEENVGPLLAGLFICHTCDTPPCVRPDHLVQETPRWNAADACRKGRMVAPVNNNPFPEGNEPSNVSLTIEGARKLRDDIRNRGPMSLAKFAARRGLPLHLVKDISSGRTYSKRLAS